MIKFNCPCCGQKIEAEDEHAGVLADCPKCQSRIEVPPATSTTHRDIAGLQRQIKGKAPQQESVQKSYGWIPVLLILSSVLLAVLLAAANNAKLLNDIMIAIIGCLAVLLFWVGLIWFIVRLLINSIRGPQKQIICPNVNCGFRGIAKAKARGSTIVGLFLLCCFILPGLLYFMLMGGYRYSCPQCGMQLATDN